MQVKSAVGDDHWTTLAELTGDNPYYDLIGVDERAVYRWVRKPCDPIIAVDRSQDGAYSRTQAVGPGFVPSNQLTESDPTLCARA